MICSLLYKVDSLREYQNFSPSLAFESQPQIALAYKIAEELLSITGYCLLKSRVGDQFWPFPLTSQRNERKKKIWQVFNLEAKCRRKKGEKKRENKSLYYPTGFQDLLVFCFFFSCVLFDNLKIPFRWINHTWQHHFA